MWVLAESVSVNNQETAPIVLFRLDRLTCRSSTELDVVQQTQPQTGADGDAVAVNVSGSGQNVRRRSSTGEMDIEAGPRRASIITPSSYVQHPPQNAGSSSNAAGVDHPPTSADTVSAESIARIKVFGMFPTEKK